MIQNLNDEIKKCNKCRLAKTRTKVLCGEGHLHDELMLIAQAPGENENREGRMFIGPSGKVLDELLKTISIERKEIYMTNLIKCMLPKNRKPKSDEIATCSQYLEREIELVHPKILAPLGYYAARYILEKYGIPLPPKPVFREVYGNVLEVDGKTIIPLQHPAAVLHDISIKGICEDSEYLKYLKKSFGRTSHSLTFYKGENMTAPQHYPGFEQLRHLEFLRQYDKEKPNGQSTG